MSIIPSRRRNNIYDPFCLDIWDPFHDFPFPIPSSSSSDAFWETCSSLVNTRLDWKEAHIFRDDHLLGIQKEEVVVEVEDNDDNQILQISGERYVEREDKNDTTTSGKLKRRLRLSDDMKLDHVMKDSMENGVLTIIVQKEEVKKPLDG